jgi:5,10-methylenetetrahydromethanopterin reductase
MGPLSEKTMPTLSCAFPPGPDTVEHVALAEELGYERAWLYDSPALYFDIWATLARVADRCGRIGLGTSVIVPRLRHIAVTASAVAQIAHLAPGRFILGIGAGFTGARTLGEKPMRWEQIVDFAEALRALWRGEAVEWEGKVIELMYDHDHLPVLPFEVPIWFGAEGPKGLAAARRAADGVLSIKLGPEGFDRVGRIITGTVLDDEEPADSDRVWAAAGHAAATRYHLAYEMGADMAALPNADAWRASIEALPPAERHLVLHSGHVTSVSAHDTAFVPREAVASLTFTGDVGKLRERVGRLAAKGVTELIYQPAGPDVPRELEAFARLREAVAA